MKKITIDLNNHKVEDYNLQKIVFEHCKNIKYFKIKNESTIEVIAEDAGDEFINKVLDLFDEIYIKDNKFNGSLFINNCKIIETNLYYIITANYSVVTNLVNEIKYYELNVKNFEDYFIIEILADNLSDFAFDYCVPVKLYL